MKRLFHDNQLLLSSPPSAGPIHIVGRRGTSHFHTQSLATYTTCIATETKLSRTLELFSCPHPYSDELLPNYAVFASFRVTC